MVSRFAALVLALVAGTASAAPKRPAKSPDSKEDEAKQAEAKQHIDAATAAHAAGKLDVSLTELRAAYELDPQPDLLFAIGQVQAGLGDCAGARASYEQYRAAMNNEAGIGSAVDAAIAACGAPPPAPVVATPPPAATPIAPAGPRPWYTDVVGDVLVGGGVVALVTAGLEYKSARSALDDAEHAMTLTDYNKRVDSAHSDRTFALVLGGAGAALVAGGIVHYMMHGKTETRGVAIVPTAGGGMLSFSGDL